MAKKVTEKPSGEGVKEESPKSKVQLTFSQPDVVARGLNKGYRVFVQVYCDDAGVPSRVHVEDGVSFALEVYPDDNEIKIPAHGKEIAFPFDREKRTCRVSVVSVQVGSEEFNPPVKSSEIVLEGVPYEYLLPHTPVKKRGGFFRGRI